ncbi:MAG: hypothetical protein IH856_08575, partial [Deltaproteobacteria bacterium]|nr:hypothetical protein [Deltaproteobacteria bacterium]
MSLLLSVSVLVAVLTAPPAVFAQQDVAVRWYGHAFFSITSAEGITIAT